MIAVSACLAGIACRYDGKDKEITKIKQMVERGEAIPFVQKLPADCLHQEIQQK